MNAAKAVGGDFYDFYLLDEKHLVITVADVSGKGIPASLFMVISKTVLKNFATFANAPDDYAAVMMNANNQLCQNNDEMMFVTVFFGVLEINTGKFIFVNGGHNPPIIYHAKENTCEYLSVQKNFILGVMEDVPYKQQETILEYGDLIFTYTDGVNEAMNINNEEYTSERLLEFMNSTNCRADLKELLAAVKSDVSKHVGNAEQSDDITMLALRRN
jgi:sigma-B regulation protein RsbU (phosphoserine phosphatase)